MFETLIKLVLPRLVSCSSMSWILLLKLVVDHQGMLEVLATVF
jgi:hypothetical protein